MFAPGSKRVAVLDHYDSFTYNIVELLRRLGAEVAVFEHDRVSEAEVLGGSPHGILLSPGPGHARDAHLALRLLDHHQMPFLGVCLGHQVLALHAGASIERAAELCHGQARPVIHQGEALFAHVPPSFLAARYNSLCVARQSLPSSLTVTAVDPSGEIMGLSHRHRPVHGVQFHPESHLSQYGTQLLRNWLDGL